MKQTPRRWIKEIGFFYLSLLEIAYRQEHSAQVVTKGASQRRMVVIYKVVALQGKNITIEINENGLDNSREIAQYENMLSPT